MDVNQLLQRLRNDHGDIIDNVEGLIIELHEHHVANNNDLFRGMLQEIGQLEAAVALDAFGHLLGGGGEAPVQPEPLQIPEPPAERMRPTSLVELIQTITDAAQRGNTIKAVGTKHSVEWTDIGHIDGTQIDMSDLNDVIHINRTVLNAVNQEMLDNRMICCFEAGATIEHVQEYIWPLGFRKTRFPDRYRVLPNQTGCTNLSLSGTIATGAHGNSLTKPIIADMVLSFLLLTVNENGEVLQNQIEPEDGITDRQAFEAFYPEKNLIQDNDIFHAALVNIGGMGLAYSYILRTEQAFYLTENRNFVSWEIAQEQIPILYDRNLNEADPLHSFEIFVNPYPVGPENQNGVVICTLEYTNGQPEGRRPDWHLIPHEWVRLGFNWACNNFPTLVPILLNILMRGTTTNQPVTMNAVEALDPLSGLAVSGQVTVSECAMQTQNPEDVIQKIQALIDRYQEVQDINVHQFATTPFAVRFSRPTNAYMAMQYNRQSMMIISNILVGTPNAANTLQQFRNLMQDQLPHWGMVQDVDANNVVQMYPGNGVVDPVAVFTNVMQERDPNGIFRNEFINRVFFPVQNL